MAPPNSSHRPTCRAAARSEVERGEERERVVGESDLFEAEGGPELKHLVEGMRGRVRRGVGWSHRAAPGEIRAIEPSERSRCLAVVFEPPVHRVRAEVFEPEVVLAVVFRVTEAPRRLEDLAAGRRAGRVRRRAPRAPGSSTWSEKDSSYPRSDPVGVR